jgi:hypothetical protein
MAQEYFEKIESVWFSYIQQVGLILKTGYPRANWHAILDGETRKVCTFVQEYVWITTHLVQ